MAASIDLAQFRGTIVSGSIPVTEKLLNEVFNSLVAERQGRVRQVDIQIGRDNYIQAGVKVKVGPFHKWFRPELVVSSSTQSGRVVLEIVTPGYAGLLWIGDWLKEHLPEGVSIRERRIFFDLVAIPLIGPFAQYLRRLQFTSERGSLLVSFEWRVDL